MPLKNGFEASQEILKIQKLMRLSCKEEVKDEQFFQNQECDIVVLTAFTDQ